MPSRRKCLRFRTIRHVAPGHTGWSYFPIRLFCNSARFVDPYLLGFISFSSPIARASPLERQALPFRCRRCGAPGSRPVFPLARRTRGRSPQKSGDLEVRLAIDLLAKRRRRPVVLFAYHSELGDRRIDVVIAIGIVRDGPSDVAVVRPGVFGSTAKNDEIAP